MRFKATLAAEVISWRSVTHMCKSILVTLAVRMCIPFNPFPNDKFKFFQTEFAEDNFKFDENGRKLSRWVENTVRKGEIACYEQFILFPQCFQKTCAVDT